MKKLVIIVALCSISHARAGSTGSVLPNDLLQGASLEVAVTPADLRSCVAASLSGIDGVSPKDVHYDAVLDDVSFGTSMPQVNGTVQRRGKGRIWVFIGVLSKNDEPAVRAYAAPRVKAIAEAISKECGRG